MRWALAQARESNQFRTDAYIYGGDPFVQSYWRFNWILFPLDVYLCSCPSPSPSTWKSITFQCLLIIYLFSICYDHYYLLSLSLYIYYDHKWMCFGIWNRLVYESSISHVHEASSGKFDDERKKKRLCRCVLCCCCCCWTKYYSYVCTYNRHPKSVMVR